MVATSSSLIAFYGENVIMSRRHEYCLSPFSHLSNKPSPNLRRGSSQSCRLVTFKSRASSIQSDEPSHIANLQNQFADFPYLHYSINQRLLTLETWCGYKYDQDCMHISFMFFTKYFERTGQLKKSTALPKVSDYLGIIPFQTHTYCQKEKKTLPGAQTTDTEYLSRYRSALNPNIEILINCPFGLHND